jgi:beta-phosphoglucomutase-like phosphatase (HAD superfamily)
VFDLDGTLVDTVETRIEAWMRIFREVRIKAERDHVARLIGSDGKRLAHEVADVAGQPINDDKAEAID